MPACSKYDSIVDMLIDGKFWDAIVCPYSDVMGLVVFALIVYGAVGVGLYIYSRSAILPLVLTMILGSVVVTQLPGPAVQFAGVVMLLLVAAGGYWLTVNRGPARQ